MHPIERLRYVARASGADQAVLVEETAHALAAFTGDPNGLVTACRRIIDRHPTSGPLWWLCSRLLSAPDPGREAWDAVEAIQSDRTAVELAHELPDAATICVIGWPEVPAEALPRRGDLEVLAVDALGEGSGLVRRLLADGMGATDVPTAGLAAAVVESDVVVLEALAVGSREFLGVAGSRAAAAVARHAGVPVWLVAGEGRILPERVWESLAARIAARGREPWDLDEEQVPLDLVDRVAGPAGLHDVDEALRRCDCPIAPELLRSGTAPGSFRG